MISLSFKDFRGFHDQEFVDVRPITLLVGENSAGKSSFLAGLKYAVDFVSGSGPPSFNKDPFQLGTFQQISHYRGGKAGRAREFAINLKQTVRRRRKKGKSSTPQLATISIRFANIESQAAVTSVTITSNDASLKIGLDQADIKVEFISEGGGAQELTKPSTFPRAFRTEFPRYWPYLIQDLRFKLSRDEAAEEETLFDEPESLTALLELGERFAWGEKSLVDATSAIRTKPLRTYTPGVEVRDGEGSHVPFEMAKLYRAKNKEEWRKLKQSLEEFGNTSDMFGSVEIKSFGNTASDPFQIQLSSDGPRTNLVDLGYGTSQVLPILYQVSTGTKNGMHLIQQPEVHLHPKAQAALGEYFVQSHKQTGQKFVLETHSDFIVDRVRNAVFKGVLKPEDVSIIFFERVRLETKATQINLDANGDPIDVPNNYRLFFAKEQLRLLGAEDANDN
ncbi:MAG: AAA family ATPase [Alphaproteobacteria bacterium]